MNFDDLEVTVGAPANVISMIKANKKQNENRQSLLDDGRSQVEVDVGLTIHQQPDVNTADSFGLQAIVNNGQSQLQINLDVTKRQQPVHRQPAVEVPDNLDLYTDPRDDDISVGDPGHMSVANSSGRSALPTQATLLGFLAALWDDVTPLVIPVTSVRNPSQISASNSLENRVLPTQAMLPGFLVTPDSPQLS
jgi:hypothetical protein